MQPAHRLITQLIRFSDAEHYLFTPSDLRTLLPELSKNAFKAVLSRSVRENRLTHLCQGLYLYPRTAPTNGLLLFRAAAKLRAHCFNYVSLETVLSAEGVISQIPINQISVMTSGRSNRIDCGHFGTIEFIHTNQRPKKLMDQLHYDPAYTLWKASIPLALQDMHRTRRNLDLIDWSAAHEPI